MLKRGCGATLIARDQEGGGSLFHLLHWVPSVGRRGAGNVLILIHLAIDMGLPSRSMYREVQHP